MLKKWCPEDQYYYHFVQTQLVTLKVSGNLNRGEQQQKIEAHRKFSEALGSTLLMEVSGHDSLINKVTGESIAVPRGVDFLVYLGT